MNDGLSHFARRYQGYDASLRAHDEKVGREAFTSADPVSMEIAGANLTAETFDSGRVVAAAVAETVDRERARQDIQIGKLEARVDQDLRQERDQIEADAAAELERIDNTEGLASEKREVLETDRSAAIENWQRVRTYLNPPRRQLMAKNPRIYALVMVLLAVVEAPLNELSFEYFFNDAIYVAWLMAGACGFMLLGFSHLTGGWIKQINSQGRVAIDKVGTVAACLAASAVACALIYTIAILRQGYLEFATAAPGANLAASILSEGAQKPVESMVELARHITLSGIGVQFLIINAGIFLFGFFMAVRRHDPDALLEPAERWKARATRKSDRQAKRFSKKRAAAESQHAAALKRSTDEIGAVTQDLAAKRTQREAIDRRFDKVIALVAAHHLHRIRVRLAAFDAAAAKNGVRPVAHPTLTETDAIAEIKRAGAKRASASASASASTGRASGSANGASASGSASSRGFTNGEAQTEQPEEEDPSQGAQQRRPPPEDPMRYEQPRGPLQ